MEMPDWGNMSQQEKMKLGIAGGLLVLALVLIYWFGIRNPKGDEPTPPPATEEAPAANRRVSPELLKQLESKPK